MYKLIVIMRKERQKKKGEETGCRKRNDVVREGWGGG